MKVTKVVYICHPVNAGDRKGIAMNLARARRWLHWAIERHPDCAFVMQWVLEVEVMDNEQDREVRAAGLRRDLKLVERVDELWLVGGRVSDGMTLEAAHAREHGKRIVDLTGLGAEPPTGVRA